MLALEVREPLAQRIGPYEVLLDIGSGGMGTISLARATGDPLGVGGFARLVALKRPLGALSSDPEVLQRFLDEARLLAQVHHANVVGIHQIGSDADGHFLVLDYIEGGTLDEMLTRGILHRKKLPPPVVLRIMGDILAGLHEVHEAADVEGRALHMLHRDVSAQNVLVGKDGVSRIADFGIAKAIISSTVTDKAYLQGRIPYMAPEYLMRQTVDRRLDVYAAGMTMWTALAGRMPWEDAAEAQIVKHIVVDGVPPLATAGVTIAPAIEAIVARACDRDLSKRYASAREMLLAVESLGRETGWIASHAEVAVVVEELLGMEIRARRMAIARRLSSPDSRPPAPAPSPSQPGATTAPSGAAPAAPLAAPTAPTGVPVPERDLGSSSGLGDAARLPIGPTRGLAGGQADMSPTFATSARSLPTPAQGTDVSSPRSRGPALMVIALAVVAAVVASLVWLWRTPERGLAAPQGSDVTAGLTGAPHVPVASATEPAAPSSAPSLEPSSSASAQPTAASPQATGAVSTRPVGTGARPPRPTGSQGGGPATLPTGISTNNPYR